jgi:hypothetical protein
MVLKSMDLFVQMMSMPQDDQLCMVSGATCPALQNFPWCLSSSDFPPIVRLKILVLSGNMSCRRGFNIILFRIHPLVESLLAKYEGLFGKVLQPCKFFGRRVLRSSFMNQWCILFSSPARMSSKPWDQLEQVEV